MTKAEIIKEINDCVIKMSYDRDTFIEMYNKEIHNLGHSINLDYNDYYPFLVGYIRASLEYLLDENKGV